MKKYHRVWIDGCFDCCHFGHYNLIRQAAELGDEVVAGIHSDEAIAAVKGPTVFSLEERCTLISACKWVTQIYPNAPYSAEIGVLDECGCEVCVHGDDFSPNADGKDCYEEMRQAGRFEVVPRTKAISTTNLIQRMLCLPPEQLPPEIDMDLAREMAATAPSLHTYIPTTHRIAQFANNKGPGPRDRIVYVDGTFDLLHPGHVSFLKKAKELGDYLVVGVHDDPTTEELKIRDAPIMTLQERVLNVLAMKYVDDVIIGAPYLITKELMDQIQPDIVVEGSCPTRTVVDENDIPKKLGIFKKIESDYPTLTAHTVCQRILDNYQYFQKRNKSKRETTPDAN